jgi:rare lipoprotein A
MRPMRMLRKARPAHAAVGALIIATSASAVAFAAGQADAQSAVQIHVDSRHVALGDELTVTGSAPSGAPAGQQLTLEFAPAGQSTWRTLRTTRLSNSGQFRFVAPLRETGLVRVVPSGAAVRAVTPVPPPAIAPSTARTISVGSKVRVPTDTINVLSGQSVTVKGQLLPAVAGRRVVLVTRDGNGWQVLAHTTTGSQGRFKFSYGTSDVGQRWLRVRFAGDRLNTTSLSRATQITVYRESVASWYNDGGSTACGFHATYGVANLSLPCGTNVTFRYGGRTVNATVDDRGPYVGGRDWDLNQNTAGALGFSGVGTVWSSQ